MTRQLSRALSAVFLPLFCATFAVPQFAQAENVLFQQMAGTWQGEGVRVQQISERKTQVRARTEAVIDGERLVSRNEITETPVNAENEPEGAARTYVRTYWIRPASGADLTGVYDLGMGDGADEKITSQGRFEKGILEVNQNFGGDPPYLIRSLTRFAEGVSIYSEKIWHGETQLTETRIEYRKISR